VRVTGENSEGEGRYSVRVIEKKVGKKRMEKRGVEVRVGGVEMRGEEQW
jgi:hypothetical protein